MIIEASAASRGRSFSNGSRLWALRAFFGPQLSRGALSFAVGRLWSTDALLAIRGRCGQSAEGAKSKSDCVLTPRRPQTLSRFRTLLRPPSPARKCSKCTLTPGALSRDRSIVRVLAAVSAVLCGLQRAPWASYKAALLVICLQASASSTSGSSVPPNCTDWLITQRAALSASTRAAGK